MNKYFSFVNINLHLMSYLSKLIENLQIGFNNNEDYCSIEMTYDNSYYINFAVNKEKDTENIIKKSNNIKLIEPKKKRKNNKKKIN